MRMYFHTGFVEYILFSQWVPYDALTYAVSVIAVFFIAFLHEGFRIFKSWFEERGNLQRKRFVRVNDVEYKTPSVILKSNPLEVTYPDFDLPFDALRALFRAIDMTAHFMLMLITMTFNAGLFVAVILGYAVCHFLFGRFLRPLRDNASDVAKAEDCH